MFCLRARLKQKKHNGLNKLRVKNTEYSKCCLGVSCVTSINNYYHDYVSLLCYNVTFVSRSITNYLSLYYA